MSAEDWVGIEPLAHREPVDGGRGALLRRRRASSRTACFSRLDPAMVGRILARRGPQAPRSRQEPTSAAGGTSVPVLAGAVAVAALLGGIGVVLHRRRGGGRPVRRRNGRLPALPDTLRRP